MPGLAIPGEDGFELFVSADQARTVWDACLQAGQMEGLVAVGLGARDTLRLEAGYLLYGQDMDMQTTPLEAGLSRLVHFEAGEFLGRTALQQQKSRGGRQKTDWCTDGRAWDSTAWIPAVVSWTDGGTDDEWDAVPKSWYRYRIGVWGPPTATPGMDITVEIRNRQVRARVVRPPFYSKEREKSREVTMEVLKELRYSKEHEWVAVEDGIAWIGITDYAQEQLGDVVFVELPEVDTSVQKDEPFGVVESVKAVSDIFSPISGTIVQVNVDLQSSPEMVNDDPYGDAWMIRIQISEPEELQDLMDAEEYLAFVEQEQAEQQE